MAITAAQIRAAYSFAKRVRAGKLAIQAAATDLERVHGLNASSARDFINDFKCMMEGRIFHRTMNAYATDYFLSNIQRDFGVNALLLALEAVREHLAYYEALRKTKLHKIREIVVQYTSAISQEVSLADYHDDFDLKVAKALGDSSENRKKRLQTSSKKPGKIVVQTELFVRNPDVVAEVLARAEGVCERCREQAPFLRAKDGQPYLEVHHKQQLAHGGDDTIDNALALCPNCHRELHHGKRDT